MAHCMAHGAQRGALRGGRRTPDRRLNTPRRQARGPQAEKPTRSGGAPGKGVLAETRWGDRGWVDGELEMLEDLADHLAVRDGGHDPQRPLLAARTPSI